MVALFLRPDADISDGGWTDEGGATTLFDAVDESSFSDTDYIKSTVATGDKVSLRLSDPTGTPTEPMTIRVRCKREGTDQTDLIVRLYEATSPPTLICYFEVPTVTDTFATYEHELPAAEFAAIGDFNNLYIEFESNPTVSHHGARIDLNFSGAEYFDSLTPTVPADVTDYLSCSRASIGYAKNSDGTLTQFASNQLRIGVGTGLLVEDARINRAIQSQDFATSWENVYSSTITTNSTTAPDGTTTADTIDRTSNNAPTMRYGGIPDFDMAATTNYVLSCYFKVASGSPSWVWLMVTDFGYTNRFGTYFNIATGVIGSNETQGDGSVTDRGIEAMQNGWYRCWVVGQFATAHANGFINFTGSANGDLDANDSGGTMYYWGAQFETASFPSSYIPTTTTSATRAADVVTCLNTLDSILQDTAQTALMNVRYNVDAAFSVAGSNLMLGDTVTDAFLCTAASFGSDTVIAANGPVSLPADTGGPTWLTGAKAACGNNASGRSVVMGGGTVATDANVIDLTTAAQINCLNKSYFTVSRLTVWNSRLSDTTLQTLTAP